MHQMADSCVDTDVREEDWGLPLDFCVFARHEERPVALPTKVGEPPIHVTVECVEALTPLDMMNLSSGEHDSTGHCVWLGAFLLLEAAPMLSSYMCNKSVVELGCGTGLGGIGCAVFPLTKPRELVLTDADPEVLEVCLRNCRRNLGEDLESFYHVMPLRWGDDPPSDQRLCSPFDCVLATDVLYDIGLLPALMLTARKLLQGYIIDNTISGEPSSLLAPCMDRYFVLSHVPRACFSSRHPPVKDLEGYIVEQAGCYGFSLSRIIRPADIIMLQGQQGTRYETKKTRNVLNQVSLNEMGQVGASVMLFILNGKLSE